MAAGRPERQAALDLADDQKQRLLAARTYLLAQMVEIIQERTLIISMLQARPCPTLPSPPHCHPASMHGLGPGAPPLQARPAPAALPPDFRAHRPA